MYLPPPKGQVGGSNPPRVTIGGLLGIMRWILPSPLDVPQRDLG